MKKLLSTFALLLLLSISALGNQPNPVLVKVHWVDQIGTNAEKSAEAKYRNGLKDTWKKKGYTFDSLVKTKDGLFMRFYLTPIKTIN